MSDKSTFSKGGFSPNGEAFCWQSKAARQKIREDFDGTNNVLSALAVYDGLSEIASDKQSAEFITTIAWVAGKTGASRRTVQSRVKELAQSGLIEVTTPTLRAPSKYRLIPIGNGCTTSGNSCAAIGNGNQKPLHTLEEDKESKNGSMASPPARKSAKPAFKAPDLAEVLAFGKTINLPSGECEKFFYHYEGNGWRTGKVPMKSWQAALRSWQLRGQEYSQNSKPAAPAPRRPQTDAELIRDAQR